MLALAGTLWSCSSHTGQRSMNLAHAQRTSLLLEKRGLVGERIGEATGVAPMAEGGGG